MPTLTDKQIAELAELYERTAQGEYVMVEALGFVVTPSENGRQVVVRWKPGVQKREDVEFYTLAHNAFPSLLETLAEKDARAKRFVLETCDLDHDYAFEIGKEKPRCPFCLAQGLELARAELQQANERIAELGEALLSAAIDVHHTHQRRDFNARSHQHLPKR